MCFYPLCDSVTHIDLLSRYHRVFEHLKRMPHHECSWLMHCHGSWSTHLPSAPACESVILCSISSCANCYRGTSQEIRLARSRFKTKKLIALFSQHIALCHHIRRQCRKHLTLSSDPGSTHHSANDHTALTTLAVAPPRWNTGVGMCVCVGDLDAALRRGRGGRGGGPGSVRCLCCVRRRVAWAAQFGTVSLAFGRAQREGGTRLGE